MTVLNQTLELLTDYDIADDHGGLFDKGATVDGWFNTLEGANHGRHSRPLCNGESSAGMS